MTTLAFSGTGDSVLKVTDNNGNILTIVKAHIVDYHKSGNFHLIIDMTNGTVRYSFDTEVLLDAAISTLDNSF